MKTLKTLIAPALAASLLAGFAVPASAATWTVRSDIRGEIAQLDRQIDRARFTRQISPREAAGLARQVDQLHRLYALYSRGGLTRYEQAALDRRIDAIRFDLARQVHDRDNRPWRDGREDHHRR